jgi:hypothetical protein
MELTVAARYVTKFLFSPILSLSGARGGNVNLLGQTNILQPG